MISHRHTKHMYASPGRPSNKAQGDDEGALSSDTYTIVKATLNDWKVLAVLCRKSFPESLRWTTYRFSQRWWRAALMDTAAETWLVRHGICIAAFLVIVHDELTWASRRSVREAITSERLIWSLMNPKLLCRQLLGAIRADTRRLTVSQTVANPVDTTCRIWLELAAVSPQYRRRGLYTRLVQYSEHRAREMGRQYVQGNVSQRNPGPIATLTRHGYEVVAAQRGRYIYRKKLIGEKELPTAPATSE